MFDETLKGNLSMFSVLHLITLLVLVLVFLVIYRFKDKLSKPKNDRIFRITLGFGLLLFEGGFHLWVLSKGNYTYTMIPLTGFCALTNVLTIYALLTNKTKMFNYIIYYALTGALFALVFVDTDYGVPHFRYFHYFIVHYGFLLASLYYLITKRISVNIRYYLTSSLILFIYTMLVLFANLILKENWFYLFESPVKVISDVFGLPLYTILWILTIILLTYLWYILLKFITRKGAI